MTREEMTDLVDRYFAAVDGEDFDVISATLGEQCQFSVESHGVSLASRGEIETMFRRLWSDHAAVRHEKFVYVVDVDEGRIAVRFQVVNTHHDGSQIHKSNCNFFDIADGRFARVAVYMAGDNTLTSS
jgi:nuclear transport factor 2 (NTF2) superfamily protein